MNYSSHAQLSMRLTRGSTTVSTIHSDARRFESYCPMNLQHANLNRLDVARRDLRDLKGLGHLVASSLRSDATAQGPRPFKSRRSLRATSNLYIYKYIEKSARSHD